jgi:hydrogenase expression/formation protein HypD
MLCIDLKMTEGSFLDSFSDPVVARPLADRLRSINLPRPLSLMHVCGTHEHSIARAGIRSILPEGLRLVAGPGCPVCVCPAGDIDLAIEASKRDGVIVATFGDMFRVPSNDTSLEMMKAEGLDIRIVYSPIDAIRLARENPGREVVFMAVGFETTAGPIAASLVDDPPGNFSIISSLRLIPPALKFLLERGTGSIDGFILPGHVSTVLGREGYIFLESEYGVPGVISGFEPVDVLRAILELISQAEDKQQARVVNLYRRAVSEGGNRKAREVISKVFVESDSEWRGIGKIRASGLKLQRGYEHLDAVRKLDIHPRQVVYDVLPGCICDMVILGDSEPEECQLFGKACTPKKPYGPCMVSSEGTCRARYQYRTVSR